MIVVWRVVVELLGGMLLAMVAVVVVMVPCRDGFVVGVVVLAIVGVGLVPPAGGFGSKVAAVGMIRSAVKFVRTLVGLPFWVGKARLNWRLLVFVSGSSMLFVDVHGRAS